MGTMWSINRLIIRAHQQKQINIYIDRLNILYIHGYVFGESALCQACCVVFEEGVAEYRAIVPWSADLSNSDS